MRKLQILVVGGVIVTLVSLGVATGSMLEVGRLKTRLRSAQAHADSASSWMSAFRDSLAHGGTAPPVPAYAAGHDSTWYVMLARSSSALEHFWHEQAMKARASGNMMLSKGEIESLRRQGLQDPVEDLRHDLVAHPELIPYRPTHGEFQFLAPEEIVLLPGSWVCAYFEDGMVPGHLLLRYQVLPGGRIVWRRLDGQLQN